MAWWIVTTGPSLERRAEVGIAELGLDVWLPQRLVTFKTRYMSAPAERMYPVFPGYLFARPTGIVPIWQWERELAELDPRTGRRHPVGPEVRRKIGEEAREVSPHELGAIDGVHSVLLTASGSPLLVTDLEFDRVRAHLDALSTKPVDADVWRVNDLARIADIHSPFYGQNAIVSRGERRGSIQVLLSLFGRQTATEIDVRMLERAA